MTRSIFKEVGSSGRRRFVRRIVAKSSLAFPSFDELVSETLACLRGGQSSAAVAALEARWYSSTAVGKPDYGVYDTPEFLANVYGCWLTYSRKYLLALAKLGEGVSVAEDLKCTRRLVDLGCGPGYSTAGLAELFPGAEVFGTNIPGTVQFRVAEALGQKYRFRVVSSAEELGPLDLVFASEYFEHIERPVEHLRSLLKINHPRAFLFANSFRAVSVGHFPIFYDQGRPIPNTAIGKLFSKTLRAYGYSPVKTGFWNNRPAYWKRADV